MNGCLRYKKESQNRKLAAASAVSSPGLYLQCNRTVNKATASVHSVTRELQYIQGKHRKVMEDGTSSVRRTNIIDTIGFCDSVFTPKQVLEVIKSSVKVNLCHVDKVVIVCSGRIETHHVQAVRQFMKWLQYKNHRNQFIFIYNKADHCDSEEQKVENTGMFQEKRRLLGVSEEEMYRHWLVLPSMQEPISSSDMVHMFFVQWKSIKKDSSYIPWEILPDTTNLVPGVAMGEHQWL